VYVPRCESLADRYVRICVESLNKSFNLSALAAIVSVIAYVEFENIIEVIIAGIAQRCFFSSCHQPWTGSWLKTLPVDLKVAYINSGHFKTYKTTLEFLKSVNKWRK